MLCLSRYTGESVVMTKGEDRIVVRVLAIRKKRGGGLDVRLGFDAPREYTILRDEVEDRINAAQPATEDDQ